MPDTQTTRPERRFATELRIRTNPQFDHEIEPDENEFAFWNPVTATNDLVKLANVALEVTEILTDTRKERLGVEIDLRGVRRKLESIEHDLLVKDPLTPTEAKTLKTIGAALVRRLESASEERQAEVAALRAAEVELEDRLLRLKEIIDASYDWNKTNVQVSDNLKTALAFYKDERKRQYER
jgi:hypothetical protein